MFFVRVKFWKMIIDLVFKKKRNLNLFGDICFILIMIMLVFIRNCCVLLVLLLVFLI